MEEVRKVPKMRFKEFEGEWEEKKLGEVAEFYKGNILQKSDLSINGNPCILYGELYTKYDSVIKKVNSKTEVSYKNLVLGKLNDILIPASGETNIDISTSSCLQVENVLLGGDINIIRPKNVNGIFVSYQLNHSKKNDIAKLSQGHTVVHIYNTQLKALSLHLPTLPEQTKIANFLTLVDDKIELEQQKLDNYTQYKKGMLQQIFNKTLRFKDDDGREFGEWEEKKLGEVSEIKKGQQLNKLNLTLVGEYYCLNGGINPSGYTNKFNTNKNTISISEGGNCGYVNFNKEKFWSGGHCYTLENIQPYAYVKYIYQILKYKEKNLMGLGVGTGIKNIQKSSVTDFPISLPSLPEQTKIANFLTLIDDKLELQQQKVAQLNLYKKALLQQMFV